MASSPFLRINKAFTHAQNEKEKKAARAIHKKKKEEKIIKESKCDSQPSRIVFKLPLKDSLSLSILLSMVVRFYDRRDS